MTDKEKYRLLCNSEESLPLFSRDWWLDIVCGETNWEVLLLEQKGRIVAAMPLYKPLPDVISMPSYTQTMGPWFAPDSEDTKYTKTLGRKQLFCKRFVEQLQGYSYFLQNFSHQITDWLPFHWAGYKQTTRYTYLLPTMDQPDLLWEQMSQNIRRNITKAKEKHQIVVKKGIPVEEFMHVHACTFERQHKPVPHDRETLKKLIAVCRERKQGDLWGGYDATGRLHAAAFITWQPSTSYYLAGGGDPLLRDSGAHSLVLWEAIRFTSSLSVQFDFEGSMLPGVERFFREFGAKQVPFFTITKGKRSLLLRARLKLNKKSGKS